MLDNPKYLFLNVSTDWSGPCLQLRPELCASANLLQQFQDIVITYVDGKPTYAFLCREAGREGEGEAGRQAGRHWQGGRQNVREYTPT